MQFFTIYLSYESLLINTIVHASYTVLATRNCDSIYLFFFNIYDVNTYKKTELILMYNMLDQRLLNDSLKENLA